MDLDGVLIAAALLGFVLGSLFIAVVMAAKVIRDFSEGRHRPRGFDVLPPKGRSK